MKLKVADNMVAVWMVEPENTLTDRQIDSRLRKMQSLKSQIANLKSLESEYRKLEAEVIAGICAGDASRTVTTRNFEVTNTVFVRKSLDSARLKKELPEVALEYQKETQSHKFTFKERG